MQHEVIPPTGKSVAVIPPSGKGVAVSAAPHPLQVGVIRLDVAPGLTVREIVESVQLAPELRDHAVAFISGELIPESEWGRVRLKAGAHLEIKVVPKGPLVPLIALAATALSGSLATALLGVTLSSTVLIGSLTVGGLFSAVLSTVGMLVVSAIAAPQSHSASAAMAQTGSTAAASSGSSPAYQDNPVFSLSGSGNGLNKWGAIPTVFGTYRAYPPLAAQYYTEVVGNDQFLRMVVAWGYGPLDISDLKIGESPISNFEGVQIETHDGSSGDQKLTLYPAEVSQTDLQVALTAAVGYQQERSGLNADQLSVEVSFPRGILQYNDDGSRAETSILISIEFRRVGDGGSWSVLDSSTSPVCSTGGDVALSDLVAANGGEPISGMTPEVVRYGYRWNVPVRGQYDVRILRITADSTDSKIVDQVFWTALTTFTNEDPIQFPVPLAKTALVIKASDQLNGVVSQLSGVVKMIAPDWDNGLQEWVTRATQSPAAAFRRALQYPGVFLAQSDDAIDLEALQAWSVFCETKGLKFNQYRDYAGQTIDLLADICAAGRATPALKDGKWSVVWDYEQSSPVQFFTPRNSWNFKGTRLFPMVPHAYRVQFANELNGYAVDERVVYRSGYDASNATIFEQMQPIGITHPDQIYKHAMFMFAQAILRPEQWTLDVDFEHLVCSRGSLVSVTHDVLLVGLGQGRIKSLILQHPEEIVIGFISDEVFPFESGKSYSVHVRTAADARVSIPLQAYEGPSNQINFTAGAPATLTVGDMFAVGESGQVSVEALVTRVARNPDHGATLTMLPYSRDVYDSDSGSIPAYTPTLTPLPTIPAAEIISIISDETVLLKNIDGSLVVRCQVYTKPLTMQGAILQVRIRPNGGNAAWFQPKIDTAQTFRVIFEGVNQGETYDIQVRWNVPGRAMPGPWSATWTHTIIGKSTPPPPVDTVDAALISTGDVRLIWNYFTPPLDWAGVNIYINGALVHEAVTGFSFVLTDAVLKAVNNYRIDVRAVDTTGNLSESRGVSYVRKAPDAVDSITVTRQADGAHLIEWTDTHLPVTPVTFDIFADGDLIAQAVAGFSAVTPAKQLRAIATHKVAVVVVDVDGLRSAPLAVTYVRPPMPDVSGFDLNSVGQSSFFSWGASPAVDLDYYRIKFNPLLSGVNWETASDFIVRVSGPATSVAAPALNGSYLIKAVDKDGNESIEATLIETSIDGVASGNFVGLIDEAPDFAGTRQSCVVNGSTLIMDSDSKMSDWMHLSDVLFLGMGVTGFYPQAVYTFANRLDLGDIYTCRLAAVMDIIGDDLTDAISQWETLASVTSMADNDSAAWRAQLQLRTTKDDPGASPVWSEWSNFIVGEQTIRAAEFRLLLWADRATTTPVVQGLAVQVTMQDRILSANDVSCPTGGLPVVYDGAFRVSPAVGIAGQGMATGDYYTITAKSATGFTVRFFNASNVAVARTFDWIAKGYGRIST